MPTPLSEAEGNTEGGATGKPSSDPAQSKTLRMRGNSLHGNREIPRAPSADGAAGRPGKAIGRTSGMHACGKSDDLRSTWEAAEQGLDERAGGGGGGKAID